MQRVARFFGACLVGEFNPVATAPGSDTGELFLRSSKARYDFDRPAAVVRDANAVDLNRRAAGRHLGFGLYRREPGMHEASEHAH